MDDKKKYNFMENVLTAINSQFISLPEESVKRNNQILDFILNSLLTKMKEKDPLFKSMFQRVFYGGSYYDRLRVGAPEEFDLDLLLKVPTYAQPDLTISNLPGFVNLQLKNLDGWLRQPESNKNLGKLFDEKHYLDTQKVLKWMEGLVQKGLNDFPFQASHSVFTKGNQKFKVKFVKGGPALTLKIEGDGIKMDVDLVTCFIFSKDKWPKGGFRGNPVPSKPDFFIVPKMPKCGGDEKIRQRYWRLSFQEQERELMATKGKNFKPTIKLLKKLRDNLKHHAIASYFIKTAVLQIAESNNTDLWNYSLSYTFMTVLKQYRDLISKGNIPYYWNKNNNLLSGLSQIQLSNILNRLNTVILHIERDTTKPNTVATYLLNSEEYNIFMLANQKL